jgi:hypothetical protein
MGLPPTEHISLSLDIPCRRHYPCRTHGTDSLVLFHQLRPSPDYRWVGSCIISFGACSAFAHVTTYRLAESPLRHATPEASAASLPPPLLRFLPGGAIQFPDGSFIALWTSALFTAHRKRWWKRCNLTKLGGLTVGLVGGARFANETGRNIYFWNCVSWPSC